MTVLRLEQPCDPARTQLLAWEGRFEPLVCVGKRVLLEPIRNLEVEDRFMLLITLADGTELPFTVTARGPAIGNRMGDQQVNVLRDPEAPGAVQAFLNDALRREERLRQQVDRYQKEDSINHALAGLLVKGATKETPFREKFTALIKNPSGVEIRAAFLASQHRDKAAVVFKLKNNSPTTPWRLMEARLISYDGREEKPFALRASREYWGPGGEIGQIAVVLDASAFDSKKAPERLVLELFRQGDGVREAGVYLERQLLRE